MSEVNTGIRYWKISPGQNGYLWKEFKDNECISIGFYGGKGKDWRKTKSGDLTKNPDKELIIKALKEEYEEALFSWEKVPGIDSNKLLEFLKDYQIQGVDWVDNAKIIKTEQENTIRIYDEERREEEEFIEITPIDITLNKNTMEAILKIGDLQMDTLPIKEENGQLNIYNKEYATPSKGQFSRWADIIRLFLEIKPKDKVIVYEKKFHLNAMGEVAGEYELEKEFRYPHTKKVKWLRFFDEPLDIKPIIKKFETKIWLPPSVIEMTKKDWDLISDYAKETVKPEKPDIVPVTKYLIEKALDELGIKEGEEATQIELISTLRKIVEREDNKLVDDETAWKEILDILKEV